MHRVNPWGRSDTETPFCDVILCTSSGTVWRSLASRHVSARILITSLKKHYKHKNLNHLGRTSPSVFKRLWQLCGSFALHPRSQCVTTQPGTASGAWSMARNCDTSSRAGVGEKQGDQEGSSRGWRYPGDRSKVWEEIRLEGYQEDPGAVRSLRKKLERVQKRAAETAGGRGSSSWREEK